MIRTFEGYQTIIIDSKLVDKVLGVCENMMARRQEEDRTRIKMSTGLKFKDGVVGTLDNKNLIEGDNALTISISECPGIETSIQDNISKPLSDAAKSGRRQYITDWTEKTVQMKVDDGRELITYNMFDFTIKDIYFHSNDSVEINFDAVNTYGLRNFKD